MPARIPIDRDRLAELCRRHRIRRLALFGSVLRDDFGPQSDVDVLIEFEPDERVGMVRLHEIEQELPALLGHRRLDLINPKYLNRWLRDRVLAEAEVQYAAPADQEGR